MNPTEMYKILKYEGGKKEQVYSKLAPLYNCSIALTVLLKINMFLYFYNATKKTSFAIANGVILWKFIMVEGEKT